VVAATNKELQSEIRAGRFREDLYFRLNVIPIFVPPLRDRREDVAALADHFMAGFAQEYGRRPKTFSPDATIALEQYGWPGNVRELRNVIERLMIMVPGDAIASAHLDFLDRRSNVAQAVDNAFGQKLTLHDARDRFERDFILRTLAEQQGNMSRTAEVLGVERSNLYRKLRAFGVAPARRAESEPEDEAV
jgi:two-component system nitrogen regulation response regulator NtrX